LTRSSIGKKGALVAAHNEIAEIREKRVKRAIEQAPESAKKTLTQAFSGSASPRAAIKAMCLSCVGFQRDEIRDCTAFACPLWKYRPFQTNEALGAALDSLLDRENYSL